MAGEQRKSRTGLVRSRGGTLPAMREVKRENSREVRRGSEMTSFHPPAEQRTGPGSITCKAQRLRIAIRQMSGIAPEDAGNRVRYVFGCFNPAGDRDLLPKPRRIAALSRPMPTALEIAFVELGLRE